MPETTTTLSKQDYLKRYLSKSSDATVDNEGKKEKKKRKKEKHGHRSSKHAGMRIIDDDIGFSQLGGGTQDLYSEDDEERPQLDPNSMALAGDRQKELPSSVAEPPAPSKVGQWETVPVKRARQDSDDDPSPPRRRERRDSPDADPPRRGRPRHDSDDDPSPPRRGSSAAASNSHRPSRPSAASSASSSMPPPPPPAARPAGASAGGGERAPPSSCAAPGLHLGFSSESQAAQQAARGVVPSVHQAAGLGAGEDTVYRDRKGRKLEMLSEMMKTEVQTANPHPHPHLSPLTSHLTAHPHPHISHLTSHISHLTSHLSPLTSHLSPLTSHPHPHLSPYPPHTSSSPSPPHTSSSPSPPTQGGGQSNEPVKPTWGTGLAQQRNKEQQREYERREGAKPVARCARGLLVRVHASMRVYRRRVRALHPCNMHAHVQLPSTYSHAYAHRKFRPHGDVLI